MFGDGSGPAQCEHADLDQDNEDKWIEPGSHAHESLAKVVLDTRFLHTLKYFVNFRYVFWYYSFVLCPTLLVTGTSFLGLIGSP